MLLLPLLLFLLPLSSPTTFNFTVNLICRNSVTHAPLSHWCYRMWIKDQSTIWKMSDGLIANTTGICTDEMLESFEVTSGYWNWFMNYNVFTTIVHNCTANGRPLNRTRPYSIVTTNDNHLSLNVQLFDDGSVL